MRIRAAPQTPCGLQIHLTLTAESDADSLHAHAGPWGSAVANELRDFMTGRTPEKIHRLDSRAFKIIGCLFAAMMTCIAISVLLL